MKCCFAGIVAYNPNVHRLQMVVESIYYQVERVIIVDNGSINPLVTSDFREKFKIVVIRNEQNEGIAKALNQICQYALDEGADWVLTLDHDTLCPDNIISSFDKYTNYEKAGIICPCVYYEGLELKVKTKGRAFEEIEACMTSGSLTKVSAWQKVGGYCEEYFIDFVDNDFCKKIRLSGLCIYRVDGVTMNHQLGEFKEKKFFVFRKKGTSHSPLRCYYMTRNNILFIKEYSNSVNILKEYLKLIKVLSECLFFADNRTETFRYIRKGYKDAQNGLTGKFVAL